MMKSVILAAMLASSATVWADSTPILYAMVVTKPSATAAATPQAAAKPKDTCPDMTDMGAISTNVFYVKQGETPHMPSLSSQPQFTPGLDADRNVSTTYIPDGGLRFRNWSPAKPTAKSPAGTYTCDCYLKLKLVGADCDYGKECGRTKEVDYGTVTWHIYEYNLKFENVVGKLFWPFSGHWGAPPSYADGFSKTDKKSYAYTSVTVWNSDSTWYVDTCNTVDYDDAYQSQKVSNSGRIYLWFKASPGNYTVNVGWKTLLKATGSVGSANFTLADVANGGKNIYNKFITTSDSPWSSSDKTYDFNVTVSDNNWHVIMDFNSTLGFTNVSPDRGKSGTSEGHFVINGVKFNP